MRSRKLLWLGSPFFSGALSDCGWEVRVHNFEEIAVFAWEDLVRLAGWEPDVLVVADKSRPPFVLGMEAFPCLTLFYAVDTHIHSWYPWYAQGFDACLVTPRVDHGLSDLFCEETHFLAYEPDNLDAAEAAIRRALGDAELRAALASQGLEAVNAAHRAAHRARAFTSFVLSLPPSLPQRRQAEAANIRRDWLRPIYLLEAEALKSPLLREAYLDAARGLFRQR